MGVRKTQIPCGPNVATAGCRRLDFLVLAYLLLVIVLSVSNAAAQSVGFAPPANLYAWQSGRSVELTWSPPAVGQVLGYNVYRSENSNGPWTRLNDELVGPTAHVDRSPPSGTSYYAVSAVNEGQNETGQTPPIGVAFFSRVATDAPAETFSLTHFPLGGDWKAAYSEKIINTVFDHSRRELYKDDYDTEHKCPKGWGDDVDVNQPCVIAYTGEIGHVNPVDGIERKGVKLQAWGKPDETSFSLNGSYRGSNGDDKHLYYDSHDGYDYSTKNTKNTEATVFAASAGETITGDKCRGTVALKHSSGYAVYYRHLSSFDKKVTDSKGEYKPGVRVEAGDPIGKAGGTPCKETDPQLAVHLHFEVRNKDDVKVDPYGWEGDLYGKADPYKYDKKGLNVNLWGRCTDPTQFSGAYFAKQIPVGEPALIRCDSAINFEWGTGSPDPDPVPKLPSDHFSVRWTKIENFKKGTYTFTVGANDGVRLKIDGTTLIDDWNDHAYRETSKPIAFKKLGEHLIEVEYYEKEGGARVEVRWESAGGNPPPSCSSFTVSPTNQSFGASGGKGKVAVTTQKNCNWSAASSKSWLTITSGSSGNGKGKIGFVVEPSSNTSQRQATITVQDQVFTVTQAASPLPPSNLPPAISSFIPSTTSVAPSGTVALTLVASDSENDPLIYTWSATCGMLSTTSGPGPVTWTAPGSPTTCTITVSVTDSKPGHSPVTQSVSITVQDVATPAPAAPSNLLAAALSSSQISLAWNDNSTNETGFKIERKTGTGGTFAQIGTQEENLNFFNDSGLAASTQFCYRVRATNAGGDSAYSNEACATTQAGTACSFTLFPPGQSFGASAGSGSVAVTTQAGCSWTATSSASWLTITSGSPGSGNGTVGFSVGTNSSTSQRQATITVQGQVFTVTQAGNFPPPAPDLVVTQVTGPSCGGIGGTGQFNATVLNQGNGFASATSTGFYLSTDSTVNTSDLPLGSCGTSSLNPNQSTQCSAILTIPNTPGTFFIGAIANDSNAGVIESNTGNNALAGGQITVSGNCPGALGTILVQATLNGNPITLTSGSFTLTGPGETMNWTGGIPYTFREKAAGTWTISNITNGPANSSLSSIDPSSTQVLSGGASITFTLNFTGTFLPDLQILDLNPPPGQQAVIGSQASLSGIRVQNFGAAPTGVPFSVGLYWSADTSFSISNDVFAGSCPFPALQSNQQGYIDPCVISVPPSLNPGIYYIVGFVDYNQQVAETNESNNVKVQTQWPINLVR